MTYNYKLENFLVKPINGDKRLFIYDKNGNFIDSLITDLSHWFVKNNCLVIKITNKNDIILSFESRLVAQQAADKLEVYRKDLMTLTGEITSNERPTFNTLNRNMMCLDITPGVDFQLACSTPILQIPRSRVKITINNGGTVQAGIPDNTDRFGCYFTSVADNGDPTKARSNDNDVQIGDQIWWVGSVAGFDVDSTDYIDFDYLI